MTFKELKYHFELFPDGTLFNYGISPPFSWRGIYNEVAFEFIQSQMLKEDILKNIQKAYDNIFSGYKGGDYRYSDFTEIHFEEDYSRYTDGSYCASRIAEIEGEEPYLSQEERLVKIAFKY